MGISSFFILISSSITLILGLAGNNTNFLGTWMFHRGTLSLDGNVSTVLGVSASNTFTFANTVANAGGNTVTLNTGGSQTLANNFVNNNAEGTWYNGAQFSFSGGAGVNSQLNLTGNFSSGVDQNAATRLQLGAAPNGTTEGRINISGDWSAYNKANNEGVHLGNPGTVNIVNQVSLAATAVGYNIASTSTAIYTGGLEGSAKLILNGAYTMANRVAFGGTGGNINSFGANHASGIATLSGQLANDDANGANVFSQNTGAVLRLTGQVSSADSTRALHINRSYTANNGALFLANPTGTVEFARATGVSYTGTVTVHAGTLLVSNTSGAGTGTGALTINSGAILGGSGIIGGATTVSGTLAPGNSPGVLAFTSTLTLAGSAAFELNSTTRSTGYDGVNTGAGLLSYGGTMGLTFGSAFLSGNTTFDLFQIGAGGQTGTFSSVASASTYVFTLNSGNGYSALDGSGNTWSFDHGTGDLSFTAIPEPTTWALLAGSLTALMVFRRRRAS